MKAAITLVVILITCCSFSVAQKASDPDPLLKVSWEKVTFKNQEMADELTAKNQEALVEYYNFSITCLKFARQRLSALLKESEAGNITEEYENDCVILFETLKLKKQELNLYIPELIGNIDKMLNGNLPEFHYLDDGQGQCNWGDAGYVYTRTQIDANREYADRIQFCWGGIQQYVSNNLKRPYCYTMTILHELFHLRTEYYHGQIPLGKGIYMNDAYNFSNMLIRISVPAEDWANFRECNCYGVDGALVPH